MFNDTIHTVYESGQYRCPKQKFLLKSQQYYFLVSESKNDTLFRYNYVTHKIV